MMKRYILILIVVLGLSLLMAEQFEDFIPSARARGMGGAFTGIADDVNALYFNPAGLAQTHHGVNIGFANLQNQEFSEYKTAAVGFALPKNLGTVALGGRMFDVAYEDENLMSEQTWSLGHGFTLLSDIHSSIYFGYSGNLYRLNYLDEDPVDAFGLDLGAVAILHQRTRLGFSISNLNNPKMGVNNQIELPRKLAMGVSYIPYDGVTTTIELRKDFAETTEFMGGVEAKLFEPFIIRAGVHQNPATWNCGASFNVSGISLDYAFTEHSVLGGTHYLNLGYKF